MLKTYQFGIVTDKNNRYKIYIAANNGSEAVKFLINYLESNSDTDSMESMQCWFDSNYTNDQILFARFSNGTWEVCGVCDIANQFTETTIIYDGGEFKEDFGIELCDLEEKYHTSDRWLIMDSIVSIDDIDALNDELMDNDENTICIIS